MAKVATGSSRLAPVSLATPKRNSPPLSIIPASAKIESQWPDPSRVPVRWPFYLWPGEWNMPIGQAWVTCPPPGASRCGRSSRNHIHRMRGGSSLEERQSGVSDRRERGDTGQWISTAHRFCYCVFWQDVGKRSESQTKSPREQLYICLVLCGWIGTSLPWRTLPSNMEMKVLVHFWKRELLLLRNTTVSDKGKENPISWLIKARKCLINTIWW